MNDLEYFNQVANHREWAESTRRCNKVAMKRYTEFHGMTMVELIDEACKEEENKVPNFRLSLRKRLMDFIDYLKDEGSSYNTVKNYKKSVIALYKYAGVKIPELESITGKNYTENPSQQLEYEDIITREEIRKCLEIANPLTRAIILTAVSSGSAKEEITQITLRTFLEGTKEYHNQELPNNLTDKEQDEFIKKTVDKLLDMNVPMVTTLKLVRSKVAKPYYTFTTPEATESILLYLKEKFTHENDDVLTFDSKLFQIDRNYVYRRFQYINDTLNLGKAGRYNKLNIHMLRRYFATTMANPTTEDMTDIMPDVYIDEFEGRTKKSVNKVYIKQNPENLKKIYMKYMYKVIIDQEKYNYEKVVEENNKLQKDFEDYKIKTDKRFESINDRLDKSLEKFYNFDEM